LIETGSSLSIQAAAGSSDTSQTTSGGGGKKSSHGSHVRKAAPDYRFGRTAALFLKVANRFTAPATGARNVALLVQSDTAGNGSIAVSAEPITPEMPWSLFLRLFLPFGIGFGLLYSGLTHTDSVREFVLSAVISGSIVGASTALVLGRRVVSANVIDGRPAGEVALRVEKSVEMVGQRENATRRAEQALLGVVEARSIDQDDGMLTARTGFSGASWGERITVRVSPNGAGTTVTVRSVPRFPLTLIDFGANRRNVEAILQALAEPPRVSP
jgi:hypothetical protein